LFAVPVFVLSFSSGIALAQTPDGADVGTAPAEEEEQSEPPAKKADPPPEADAQASTAADVKADISAPPPAPPRAKAPGEPPPEFEAAPGAPRCHEEPIHPGDHPAYRDHSCFRKALSWNGGHLYGGVEIDVGYARYDYPERKNTPYETLYDMRGRFVMGPYFQFPLGSKGYFLALTGTVVGWIREQADEYQINVDDVWAMIGHEGTWDFQLGRFMTWRVYHKGLGFDLYTLEDNGPSIDPPISADQFLLHTYEVDYIFMRNSPYVDELAGRAAIHYYPTRFLGFELAGAYGVAEARGSNTIGTRFAADFHWKYVRASVGAEFRMQKPTTAQAQLVDAMTPNERYVECVDCGYSDNRGIGGGLVFKYTPVEIGGGIAKGAEMAHINAGGPDGFTVRDKSRTLERTSFGGYVELDPGSLIFKHPLIFGAGLQKTEYIREDFVQRYMQNIVGYVAFPLGFNDAMVKFVLSQADGERYDPTDPEGNEYIRYERKMTSGRFRFSSAF
jgi:hypothetical protein